MANNDVEMAIGQNQKLTGLITQRNAKLMASICYARRIQDALFPAELSIGFFTGTACHSKPKGVVSGDFLWHHLTSENVFLAVADCTGHGVPGAMMSMLGNNLLNQMVLDRRIHSPQQVLAELDHALEALFNHHKSDDPVHDGMDMGYFMLDKNNLELTFAGALVRCMIIRAGELIRLECARHALGGCLPATKKEFSQIRFQLQPGDRIVLSTDGYQSQFGGPLGKKMKAHEFRALVLRTAQLTPAEGIAFLDSEFSQWSGAEEQIDDVLVVLLGL